MRQSLLIFNSFRSIKMPLSLLIDMSSMVFYLVLCFTSNSFFLRLTNGLYEKLIENILKLILYQIINLLKFYSLFMGV